MNTTNGSKVKTVCGKPVTDDCITCGTSIKRDRWLCAKCCKAIGSENINNTVAGMPEYLDNSQYQKWLKFKLSKYLNENKT